MKNLKTLILIALITFVCIGFQSCSAEEVEIQETENTNINGTKS